MALLILASGWGRLNNMFGKKKNPQQNATENQDLAQNADDFEYVQLDASIHEQKFNTKPTTFFSDAVKRFVKSRSSVVGAVILVIIIGMAIIVPMADRNNIINDVKSSQYLPPKWFDVNANGFMDGTGYVSDVTLDPDTKLPAASLDEDGVKTTSFSYFPKAVLGSITTRVSYVDALTPMIKAYGRGGSVSFTNNDLTTTGVIASPSFTYDMSDDLSLTAVFNGEGMAKLNSKLPLYTPYLLADLDGTSKYTTAIPLASATSEYSNLLLHGVTGIISADASYVASKKPATFKALFAFALNNAQDSQEIPSLLIKSVTATASKMDVASVSFADATQMLSSSSPYSSFSNGKTSVYQSENLLGSFRYDYYEGAFGEDEFKFDKDLIQKFIAKGWMTYTFNDHLLNGTYPAGEFALTEAGETYCPIRSVSTEFYSKYKDQVTLNVTGVRSRYRYDYYQGWIPSCAYQKYVFGTNDQGFDFFKVIFSGLLTSLELGFLSAVINIIVGLIWGSISGYFGGITDLIMERVTEILGGIPWIVMMTLIILREGSNFWTFLLALCLTGWMGVAGLTRSQFYRYKGREYVLASRTLGASDARLIFKHILPNGIGTIVTSTAFMIPGVIFSEATISYLLPGALSFKGGTSFGVTLARAQGSIQTHPYLIISASIVMMLIMISFNLFGNGLRDAFNPSLKGEND